MTTLINNILIIILSFLYLLFTTSVSFLLIPFFLLSKKGRINLHQRFGIWPNISDGISSVNKIIWFHAASLGEVSGIENIISKLSIVKREQILITTTSPYALKKAKLLTDKTALLPFDSFLYYFIAYICGFKGNVPSKIIITETEVWPGLLFFAWLFKIPVIWVNARILSSNASKLKIISVLLKPIFKNVESVYCQNQRDVDSFKELNFKDVSVVGNSKYDIQSPKKSSRETFGIKNSQTVISVTNIRKSEFKVILDGIKKHTSKALYFIIPRQASEFNYFESNLENFNYVNIDNFLKTPRKTGVVLVNKFGLLEELLSISNAVISAGSFSKELKGHNLLNAAIFDLYQCTGAYNKSSQDLFDTLKDKNAVTVASTSEDIQKFVEQTLKNHNSLKDKLNNSKKILLSNFGVAEKLTNYILYSTESWQFYQYDRVFSIVSYPLSILYSICIRLKNFLYDIDILKSYRSKLPVISVGNFSVGGTGKTPLVIDLVNKLVFKGYKPAIVTRGYKRKSNDNLVLSSNDNSIILDSNLYGDEPIEIFAKTQCPVFIGKNRVKSIKSIENNTNCDIIILDDGLQHRKINPKFSIACIDASSNNSLLLLLSGNLLPLGFNRESIKFAKNRVNLVNLSFRSASNDISEKILRKTFSEFLDHKLTTSKITNAYVVNTLSVKVDPFIVKELKFIAFCCIANPNGFSKVLTYLNLKIINELMTFSDHHYFSQSEEQELLDLAKQSSALLLCTSKDYYRLSDRLQKITYRVETEISIEPDPLEFLPL